MLFDFPKKKINDTGWFLTNENVLEFGTIKLITIAINEDECKVYYRFINDEDEGFTVQAKQVLDNQMNVPVPKYSIGDRVYYMALDKEGKNKQQVGVIGSLEIGMYEEGVIEISYVMEHDEDEWVMEEEIVSHDLEEIEYEDEYNYTKTDL